MRRAFFCLLAVAFVFFAGCKTSVEEATKNGATEKGSITGKAIYSNSSDYSGIVITIEKTDGLRSTRTADISRSADGTYITSSNGKYTFNDLTPGTYTVYASSQDSMEKAVSTNVVAVANRSVTVSDLQLTATGSISGTITLDNSTDANYGFIIYVAGTSYSAMTDKSGAFKISGVPAGSGYSLVVSRGNFLYLWRNNISVQANNNLSLEDRNFTYDEIYSSKEGISITWLGSFVSATEIQEPKKNDAYFNTTDKLLYIFDGTRWVLLTKTDSNESGKQNSEDITVTKSDFRGTWVVDYVDQRDRQVAVVNIFDGKSESIATEGVFVQSKIRFNTNNLNEKSTEELKDEEGTVLIQEGAYAGKTPNMRNFYYGTYELHNNSNYTAGRLSLTYKYGIQWDGGEEVDLYFYGEDGTKTGTAVTYTISQLTDIAFNKKGYGVGLTLANANDNASYKSGEEFFAAHFKASHRPTGTDAGKHTNPTITVAFGTNTYSNTVLCADIEHFSFALADATATGYNSMIAEEWWTVDQISFALNESTYTWYYLNNEISGDTKTLTSWFGGGTRDVTYMAPGRTNRGSIKNHGTGPFDKKYWSAAICDWEIPKGADNATRTYAQITTDVDMDKAINFVEGKIKDKNGRVIDYVVNTAIKDAEADSWDCDLDDDDY